MGKGNSICLWATIQDHFSLFGSQRRQRKFVINLPFSGVHSSPSLTHPSPQEASCLSMGRSPRWAMHKPFSFPLLCSFPRYTAGRVSPPGYLNPAYSSGPSLRQPTTRPDQSLTPTFSFSFSDIFKYWYYNLLTWKNVLERMLGEEGIYKIPCTLKSYW